MKTLLVSWLLLTVSGCVTSTCDFNLNEHYLKVTETVQKIRDKCGDVCDTGPRKNVSGRFFDVLEKNIDCQSLFQLQLESLDEGLIPPRPINKIPKGLHHDFSYGNRIEIKSNFFDDSVDANAEHRAAKWTKEAIDKRISDIKNGVFKGFYQKSDRDSIRLFLETRMNVTEKHVFIIGSQEPWLESLALALGARHVTTLEYNKLTTDHPQISLVQPTELAVQYLSAIQNKEPVPQFDLMVSFSSLEHSGLGRYGDLVNPWGDLIEMARTHCLIRPGGQALVGVPTHRRDMLLFNAARIYSDLQYAHLFANWIQVYTNRDLNQVSSNCDWCYQPLFILERPGGPDVV